jgi:hypothetical protein
MDSKVLNILKGFFDQDIFNFSVQCPKELFDKLADGRCRKINWEAHKFELLTYWQK